MNKIFNLLGLAARARKIVTGEELVINEIRRNKVKLVIVSTDASANTNKNIMNKCQYYNVKCLVYGTREDLGVAIGKDSRVMIGITDQGFAKKLGILIHDAKGESL